MTQDPWNDFVDRAIEDQPQRKEEGDLYALFYYQAEVNNGGHHQYFYNWSEPADWQKAVAGARRIGMQQVADLLEEAIALWQTKTRPRHATMDEFLADAREAEFEVFDERFYAIDHELQTAFERAVS